MESFTEPNRKKIQNESDEILDYSLPSMESKNEIRLSVI